MVLEGVLMVQWQGVGVVVRGSGAGHQICTVLREYFFFSDGWDSFALQADSDPADEIFLSPYTLYAL